MKSLIDRLRCLFPNQTGPDTPPPDPPQQPYDFAGSESAVASGSEKHPLMHSDITEAAACRRVLRRIEQQLTNSVAEIKAGIHDLGEEVREIINNASSCMDVAEQGLSAASRGRETSEVVCRMRGTLNGIIRDAGLFQRGKGKTAASACDLDQNSLADLAFQLIELDELLVASGGKLVKARETLGHDISQALSRLKSLLPIVQNLEHLAGTLAAVQDSLRPFERAATPAAVQARLRRWTDELSQICNCESSRGHHATFDSQAMSVVGCDQTGGEQSF